MISSSEQAVFVRVNRQVGFRFPRQLWKELESFQLSPQKSTARASREFGIPQTTVWYVLRERLQMYPYRLMMVQHLTREDHTKRLHFCHFKTCVVLMIIF